jgi:hypothetical protein
MVDELHFGMAGGSRDFEGEDDESDAIPINRRRRRAPTELERFDLGRSGIAGYECEDVDDPDVDEEGELSQADD